MRARGRHAALLLGCSLLAGGCWLQPGFDAGRTSWNPLETAITPATVAGLAPAWDYAEPGGFLVTAPVSLAGTVYTTSSPGVVALDAATGSVRWAHPMAANTFARAPVHLRGVLLVPYRMGGTGPGNPITAGGVLSLDPASGAVLADDDTGDAPVELTEAAGGLVVRTHHQPGSPGEGTTNLQRVRWDYTPTVLYNESFDVPPTGFAVVRDRIVWPFDDTVRGYSPACPPSGSDTGGCGPDWVTDVDPLAAGTVTSPAATGGDVVVAESTGLVAVVDAVSGAVEWTADAGAPVRSRPAIAGGTALVTTDDGRVVALAAAGCGAPTCTPVWEGTVAPAAGSTAGAPVAAGDVVYVPAGTEVVAFDLRGCPTPPCEPVARISVGLPVSDLVVSDGRLLVTASHHLVAFALP